MVKAQGPPVSDPSSEHDDWTIPPTNSDTCPNPSSHRSSGSPDDPLLTPQALDFTFPPLSLPLYPTASAFPVASSSNSSAQLSQGYDEASILAALQEAPWGDESANSSGSLSSDGYPTLTLYPPQTETAGKSSTSSGSQPLRNFDIPPSSHQEGQWSDESACSVGSSSSGGHPALPLPHQTEPVANSSTSLGSRPIECINLLMPQNAEAQPWPLSRLPGFRGDESQLKPFDILPAVDATAAGAINPQQLAQPRQPTTQPAVDTDAESLSRLSRELLYNNQHPGQYGHHYLAQYTPYTTAQGALPLLQRTPRLAQSTLHLPPHTPQLSQYTQHTHPYIPRPQQHATQGPQYTPFAAHQMPFHLQPMRPVQQQHRSEPLPSLDSIIGGSAPSQQVYFGNGYAPTMSMPSMSVPSMSGMPLSQNVAGWMEPRSIDPPVVSRQRQRQAATGVTARDASIRRKGGVSKSKKKGKGKAKAVERMQMVDKGDHQTRSFQFLEEFEAVKEAFGLRGEKARESAIEKASAIATASLGSEHLFEHQQLALNDPLPSLPPQPSTPKPKVPTRRSKRGAATKKRPTPYDRPEQGSSKNRSVPNAIKFTTRQPNLKPRNKGPGKRKSAVVWRAGDGQFVTCHWDNCEERIEGGEDPTRSFRRHIKEHVTDPANDGETCCWRREDGTLCGYSGAKHTNMARHIGHHLYAEGQPNPGVTACVNPECDNAWVTRGSAESAKTGKCNTCGTRWREKKPGEESDSEDGPGPSRRSSNGKDGSSESGAQD